MRRVFGWILTALACAGVVLATSYGFSPAAAPSGHAEWMLFDVAPDATVLNVANDLSGAGMIRSKVCFLLAERLSGGAGHIKAGEYRLSPTLSVGAIVKKFAQGDVVSLWVAIPPGSTLNDIGTILARQGLAHDQRFKSALQQYAHVYQSRLHLTAPTLEGYLFPDTYTIPRSLSEQAIVRMMVARFQESVLQGLRSEILDSPNGLDIPQTMVLASIIQKECPKAEEASHIAGVLINRLRNDMPLDCDSTVAYVLRKDKDRLSQKDKRIDSPYNTYRHRGLPPAPICNPGLTSIKAALAPEPTRDLYCDIRPDGYHIFSRSRQDHQRALAAVQRMFQQQGQ